MDLVWLFCIDFSQFEHWLNVFSVEKQRDTQLIRNSLLQIYFGMPKKRSESVFLIWHVCRKINERGRQ